MSTYFNAVRNIPHGDVYCGIAKFYILNQLNGTRPFSANPKIFSNCISRYDKNFICSPKGPDVFIYDLCMKQNKLLKTVIDIHHDRGSNSQEKTKTRSNKKTVSV